MNTNMNKNQETKCPEASSTLILYIYGEADNPAAFESHLETCPECRKILDDHRLVLSAYRREVIEAPGAARVHPEPSWWDRFSGWFASPVLRPVLAGAAALTVMAAIVLWHFSGADKPIAVTQPSVNDKTVPSYSEMTTQMDEIEDELDSMFAMNGFYQFDSEEESEEQSTDFDVTESYSGTTDIFDELDDIQENIRKF